MNNVISWFDDFNGFNEYAFLSNFFIGEPLEIDGAWFQTGEHAFQAFKTHIAKEYEAIVVAPSPGAAKMLGRKCTLRDDWEAVKYDVMALVVRTKFTMDRPEGPALLDTDDLLLVEGTYWNDTVWGVDLLQPHLPGRNWLGTLLMARRAELRSDALVPYAPAVANAEFAL